MESQVSRHPCGRNRPRIRPLSACIGASRCCAPEAVARCVRDEYRGGHQRF